MSDDAPSGKLMRIRVYEDDAEMTTIYDRFNQVRENSRSHRGRARRGAESEWLRRIMVAGYTQLYGPFYSGPGNPAPTSTSASASAPAQEAIAALPQARNTAVVRKQTPKMPEITAQDKQTNVAQSAPATNNDTAQQRGHSPTRSGAVGLDFKQLLGGGNNIVSSLNPTSEAP